MKINKKNAYLLWGEHYGDVQYVEDFHGNLMYRNAYGDKTLYIISKGRKLYCGWNIHHILPLAHGGTNEKHNLICTNIITNNKADDRITYWIDNRLYQVKRVPGVREYHIIRKK